MAKKPSAGGLRTNAQVSLAFDWLAEGIEKDALPMYRKTMVRPLVAHVLSIDPSGDDKADLRRLRDSMPDAFDKMDGTAFEKVAEAGLMQAHLLGETAAMPANMPVAGEGNPPGPPLERGGK